MDPQDTIVYVDGYNLYYGLLAKRPYKWLDLVTLCHSIANGSGHKSRILKLKYFTAPVKANERSGPESVQRQSIYQQALCHHNDEGVVEIIKGFHVPIESELPRVDTGELVSVRRYEEKQTDVNIAVHALIDAMNGKMAHAIVVSNDSDLESLFYGLKSEFPALKLGHIAPREKSSDRSASTKLMEQADWSREYVLKEELRDHQLPRSVVRKSGRRKKHYTKPEAWQDRDTCPDE